MIKAQILKRLDTIHQDLLKLNCPDEKLALEMSKRAEVGDYHYLYLKESLLEEREYLTNALKGLA